ncbi:MAG: ATP-binding protein [Acidobacteriota bacterium]|nr:ATP-binding protein [Acidobacteriota bacterium]
MDATTIQSLTHALEASPDNYPLLMTLLRGMIAGGVAEEGFALMQQYRPDLDFESAQDQVDAAICCLEAGEAETALEICRAEGPEVLIIRATALADLERPKDALDVYRKAVRANPTLEDKELEARINARTSAHVIDRQGHPTKLRVISNDDTDQTELKRLLNPEEEKVTFADVGGLDGIKKQIEKRIILPFQKPSIFQRFKKRVGGGILLYGPPGCGKTLLARATAGECDAQFFNVAIQDVLDMYIGESERKLHAIFDEARRKTPSVLFFDEIEALGGKRQYTREGTASKLVSLFLAEMDGFAKDNQGVLILGATNVPWSIDPAFRRPGRFDRVLFVPPPDRDARASILNLHLAGRPVAGGIDTRVLAKGTSGFSGADLLEVVETAGDLAIEASLAAGSESPITQAMLKDALDDVKPTTLEWLTTARNYARYANEGGQYDEVLAFLKKHGKN